MKFGFMCCVCYLQICSNRTESLCLTRDVVDFDRRVGHQLFAETFECLFRDD